MKPLSLKEKAINYRKRGYSYGMISEKLGLSKSTLSNWLKEIPYKPGKEALKRIKLAPIKSAQIAHNRKVANIVAIKKLAKKELGKLTNRDLWLLGIGLYLGEGSKLYERITVINSDPEIIKLAIKWFREICGLKNENLSIAIHTYPDNNIKDTINYWSKVTRIPKKQFEKTQVDRRINKSEKKKRKLPYGTAHLYIRSRGEKEFGKSLHRRIMGWIDATLNQI
ncbi:helix-turn-helix domain-containing protein [bacterium]|nr:MAG: helix-turn-helix domain-containing protein [bacterium]